MLNLQKAIGAFSGETMLDISKISDKRRHLDELVSRFGIMADYFELYEYTNAGDEIEDGMVWSGARLYLRGPSPGLLNTVEYAADYARHILSYATSDRAVMPYDSLGRHRQSLADGTLPPISPDRKVFPLYSTEQERFAFADEVRARIIDYVDQNVDLTGYGWPDVARCMIEAALRHGSLGYANDWIVYQASLVRSANGGWNSHDPATYLDLTRLFGLLDTSFPPKADPTALAGSPCRNSRQGTGPQ